MIMERVPRLEDKRIVLGVTGSIAAYKAVMLASRLTQAGALVDVIMTESAQRFVTPLSFSAVTGRPAYTSMWQTGEIGSESAVPVHIVHVGLGENADLLVIAPATANTIARLAQGVADDLLTVAALAARCPVVVAPAMDAGMFAHPAVQANLDVLESRGVVVVGPTKGRMASGMMGKGRMVEPDAIVGYVRRTLGRSGPLAGRRVLVTAGPTREMIDPVRFITNWSTGKQGYALAQCALDRGADVTLITGPAQLAPPEGAEVVRVMTTQEMLDAVMAHIDGVDILMMAAAPVDYRPEQVVEQKIKKGDALDISLVQTPDILAAVGKQRRKSGWPMVLVGFAAESEHLVENAKAKLNRKSLDLIVANDITIEGSGFGYDTNRVTLLDYQGGFAPLPLMSKQAVADAILERIERILHVRDQPGVNAPSEENL
jgi:phosphopantothenoylcysteine decarboxylase/phosphopantothenate--cysteine ligase